MSILLLVLGVGLLYFGGDLLVANAVRLARRFGISALVIGLTVVAFGTSAPELAATLASALGGAPGIAMGNVVGSNIANIGLILGVTALVYPLPQSPGFFGRDLPATLCASALLIPLLWDGRLGRLEGALLLALLGGYIGYVLLSSGAPPDAAEHEPDEAPLWRTLALLLLGVGLLIGGARALVVGAVAIARTLGVPEEVIGLTLVAFGTSLPELASSVVAALRKETDIILGNVIGSNLFNVLAVLGTTVLVSPIAEPFGVIAPDLYLMLAFSLLLGTLMLWGKRLGRGDGALLFSAYVLYIVFAFL